MHFSLDLNNIFNQLFLACFHLEEINIFVRITHLEFSPQIDRGNGRTSSNA